MHPSFIARFPLVLRGVVSKAKVMQKTVTVSVPRRAIDKRTRKEIIQHTKYLVHDENEICNVQDVVRIASCRRLSTRKTYAIDHIDHKADRTFLVGTPSRPAMTYAGLKLGPVKGGDLTRRKKPAKQVEDEGTEERVEEKSEEAQRTAGERALLEQARPLEAAEIPTAAA